MGLIFVVGIATGPTGTSVNVRLLVEDGVRYAVGIFLNSAAGVKSNGESRIRADISNRPRYSPP